MEIKVTTQYSEGVIVQYQELIAGDYGYPSISQNVTQRVIHLQEQGVREALKRLGYLSPEEAKQLLEAANSLRCFREGTIQYKDADKVVVDMLEEYCKKGGL